MTKFELLEALRGVDDDHSHITVAHFFKQYAIVSEVVDVYTDDISVQINIYSNDLELPHEHRQNAD